MNRRLALLGLALLLAGGPLQAKEGRPTEYEVKAAFLYNFARFVTWPDSVRHDTLRICIVGQDPFGDAFESILARHPAQPIRLQRLRRLDATPEGCHILFVSRDTEPQTRQALVPLRDRPVLTVSDIDGFAASGGIIGFVIRQNKVRFQINPRAAERAGIVLSAKLLRLAEIVAEGSP